MAIADLRREYNLAGLRRADLALEPITQFKRWFEQATATRASGRMRQWAINVYKRLLLVTGTQPTEVNAMTLATVDAEGRPTARTVLLKGVDNRGFIFFTNYESRKGLELAGNPNASLVFYWASQERQVCVAGKVERLGRGESEAYFRSRPRGSRIGAWASRQSSVVKDRQTMEQIWAEAEKRFPGEVPMPEYWGGYLLQPIRVEFWQGRPNRMHDRFCYSLQTDGTWLIDRLSP
jgi:pyridoxamine 5'-phosphate oxidase